jgi:hypothetical protein
MAYTNPSRDFRWDQALFKQLGRVQAPLLQDGQVALGTIAPPP